MRLCLPKRQAVRLSEFGIVGDLASGFTSFGVVGLLVGLARRGRFDAEWTQSAIGAAGRSAAAAMAEQEAAIHSSVVEWMLPAETPPPGGGAAAARRVRQLEAWAERLLPMLTQC